MNFEGNENQIRLFKFDLANLKMSEARRFAIIRKSNYKYFTCQFESGIQKNHTICAFFNEDNEAGYISLPWIGTEAIKVAYAPQFDDFEFEKMKLLDEYILVQGVSLGSSSRKLLLFKSSNNSTNPKSSQNHRDFIYKEMKFELYASIADLGTISQPFNELSFTLMKTKNNKKNYVVFLNGTRVVKCEIVGMSIVIKEDNYKALQGWNLEFRGTQDRVATRIRLNELFRDKELLGWKWFYILMITLVISSVLVTANQYYYRKRHVYSYTNELQIDYNLKQGL